MCCGDVDADGEERLIRYGHSGRYLTRVNAADTAGKLTGWR